MDGQPQTLQTQEELRLSGEYIPQKKTVKSKEANVKCNRTQPHINNGEKADSDDLAPVTPPLLTKEA